MSKTAKVTKRKRQAISNQQASQEYIKGTTHGVKNQKSSYMIELLNNIKETQKADL